MGHQFARATVAAALIVALAACGGGDGEADPPPVLDNARDLVAAAGPTTTPTGEPDDTVVDAAELPAPDPSRFEGSNRVVNLFVAPDGTSLDIDVWGRRTFENAPILLAEGVSFGDASEYFAAPREYEVVVVGSGAGPDGVALAEVFNAVDLEQITMIFANDSGGEPTATHVFERETEQAISAPEPGTGVIVIHAPNFRAFSDELVDVAGSDAFAVGDGGGECRRQRREGAGLEPELLGDTQPVEIQVPPGQTRLSLHPWFPTATCSSPSALDIDVTVDADAMVLVLVVWSPDETIEWRALPIG